MRKNKQASRNKQFTLQIQTSWWLVNIWWNFMRREEIKSSFSRTQFTLLKSLEN